MTHVRIVVLLPLLVVALLWAVSLPARAQDDSPAEPGNGDSAAGAQPERSADDQPEGEGDGDGEAPAEGEAAEGEAEAEITPGAETPREAAEAFLRGVKERNIKLLLAMLATNVRAQFEDRANGAMLLKALTLHSFEVGEITVNGQSATIVYKWKASLDVSKLVEAVLAMQLEALRDQGLSQEELDMQAEFLSQLLTEFLRDLQLQEYLERESQRMTLVQSDGRWYVSQPLVLPDGVAELLGE